MVFQESAAVVITSYNRPSLVLRAVRSVVRQKQFAEILVVDDASERPVNLDEVSDSRVRLVRSNTNQGVAISRNLGVQSIRSKNVLFLDDDDVLLPWAGRLVMRWIGGRAKPQSDRTVHVGGVMVVATGRLPAFRRPPSSRAGQVWGLDNGFLRPGRTFATKQAALIPVSVVKEIGGFDGKLRSRVTSEFFFRLTEVADVVGHAWPIYMLNRGNHKKITGDASRREKSANYIREKHACLLADPQRRQAFEENHKFMVQKVSAVQSTRED